jgi:hypothetical protein
MNFEVITKILNAESVPRAVASGSRCEPLAQAALATARGTDSGLPKMLENVFARDGHAF